MPVPVDGRGGDGIARGGQRPRTGWEQAGWKPVRRDLSLTFSRRDPMRWKKPIVTEIALGMEINCYACADV
ncbi:MULTISPECIES: pyrroloquinoline quinone precursor peptide PqqA [Nitrospirillum]|uniref:pyrroloquinoline quinone precursor peptide PqqA n=1 Tax=Nitrospirillum amazonense TaxID=28077 RepID=UPI00398C1B7D